MLLDAELGECYVSYVKPPVDTEMSDTSTNAVQNKVIKAYVDGVRQDIPTKTSRLTNDGDGTNNNSPFITQYKLNLTNAEINAIKALIPQQATTSNQLADKAFVNSSISTETAYYRSNNGEPFNSVEELRNKPWQTTNPNDAWYVTNNDYAIVKIIDSTTGQTKQYDRYKCTVITTIQWALEYTLNNSSFTAAQWAAINSGVTAALINAFNLHIVNTNNPHNVTKVQIGLGNVGNFKAVSTETNQGLTDLEKVSARANIEASKVTASTTEVSGASTAKSLNINGTDFNLGGSYDTIVQSAVTNAGIGYISPTSSKWDGEPGGRPEVSYDMYTFYKVSSQTFTANELIGKQQTCKHDSGEITTHTISAQETIAPNVVVFDYGSACILVTADTAEYEGTPLTRGVWFSRFYDDVDGGFTQSIQGVIVDTPETHKISSDMVDDTNQTNKFVTSAEKAQIITNQTDIATINSKIPAQATTSNQLADKAFVNSTVQTATANFRGNWTTWIAVPTGSSLYPVDYAGSKIPTVNDYLVVQDASDYINSSSDIDLTKQYNISRSAHSTVFTLTNPSGETSSVEHVNDGTTIKYLGQNNEFIITSIGNAEWTIKCTYKVSYNGTVYQAGNVIVTSMYYNSTSTNLYLPEACKGTWRFKYSGVWTTLGKSGWLPEYQVNEEPLTAAQLAALNSGITSSKVSTYDGYASQINSKTTVSGTNDGTDWKTITIEGVTKNIPQSGTVLPTPTSADNGKILGIVSGTYALTDNIHIASATDFNDIRGTTKGIYYVDSATQTTNGPADFYIQYAHKGLLFLTFDYDAGEPIKDVQTLYWDSDAYYTRYYNQNTSTWSAWVKIEIASKSYVDNAIASAITNTLSTPV